MIKTFTHGLMRWRWAVVILSLLAVVLAGSGGQFLKFNNDYRIFFDGDNPQLMAFEQLQDTYTKNDNALLVLAPKSGNVFNKETMIAVADITERAWQVPYSLRVDSLSNYQHTYAEGDDLIVEDLIPEPNELSPEILAKIEKIALNEPLLLHRLISPSGHVTAINITIELPGVDVTKENPEAVEKVREIERYIHATYPDIDVYLSGIVMMNAAFPEATFYDMTHLIPLAIGLIMLLVLLMLRQIIGTIVTFFVVVFSIICAMGLAGWLGIELSPPVMSVPTIIMTLAIADCVHILSNWRQEMAAGSDKITAMQESLRLNFTPVFLTSLTTAIGFMSMNFSDAPPFRDLGNLAAIGVIFAWLFSVTFLPALLVLLPTKNKAKKTTNHNPWMQHLADFVLTQQNRLLWTIGIAIVVLFAFIPRNELNDIFVEYFDEKIQFRTDTEFMVKNLTGVYFIDFSLDSKEENGISKPEFQQQIEDFSQWLRQQDEVIHVNSITDIMKRLNRSLHADEQTWYKLPNQRDLAAQYLLLYEMSLPYGLDLNNQIDIGKRATRLMVSLETLSSKDLIAFEQKTQQWMADNTPEIQTIGSSPSIMFAHIGQKNITSMLTGTVIAFLVISLILMIAFRSWKYGLVSLLPNIIPAGMAFGLWGIISGQIGLSLSVVAAMTMGVVVDDTVHFLSKYRRGLSEKNLSSEDAVRYAFQKVGTALWVTSAALVAGFLVISTSSFELNSGMGFMVTIVVIFALLADFLFLPPLLVKLSHWLDGKK